MDLWAATQLDGGVTASRVLCRLPALSSFYRYCVAHDLIGRVPTEGLDPDYTATVGLDRDQARALVADADPPEPGVISEYLRSAPIAPPAASASSSRGTSTEPASPPESSIFPSASRTPLSLAFSASRNTSRLDTSR